VLHSILSLNRKTGHSKSSSRCNTERIDRNFTTLFGAWKKKKDRTANIHLPIMDKPYKSCWKLICSTTILLSKIVNRFPGWYIEVVSAKFSSSSLKADFANQRHPLLTSSNSSQQKIKEK